MRAIAIAVAHGGASVAARLPRPRWTVSSVAGFQRRRLHAWRGENIPPPLAAPVQPQRTGAGGRRASPSREPGLSGAPSAFKATPLSWADVLDQAIADQRTSSRVVLSEISAVCLSVETPKCYAVYRPSPPSSSDDCRAGPRGTLATPEHFLRLLGCLRSAVGMSTDAARVAQVFVDLLNKPLHPQRSGPWDLTPHEVRLCKARSIACAMSIIVGGDEALTWLARLLRLEDPNSHKTAETGEYLVHLLWTALTERYSGLQSSPLLQCTRLGDTDGEWLLTRSPAVLGAVAAAMLRSRTEGMKTHALELLEAAAVSRLSFSSPAPSTATLNRLVHSGHSETHATGSQPLFNEDVAVHCAEVAAAQGDSENVTRLIFLLYRTRGALGFATLAEHRHQSRIGHSKKIRRDTGRCGSWMGGGLLPSTSAWFRARWSDSGVLDSGLTEKAEEVDEAATDQRFEQAVVRLLKSAMHAVLFHRQSRGLSTVVVLDDALKFWNDLRQATSWSGLAAMGMEVIQFLIGQHALLAAAIASDETPNASSDDAHVQRAALLVYNQLCLEAPVHRRTQVQRALLNHAASSVMCVLTTGFPLEAASGAAVPVATDVVAAEQILRLFLELSGSAAREAVLHYVLAALLTVLTTAATRRGYQIPRGLCTSLAVHFSQVQSVHYYSVAVAPEKAKLHATISGSLFLLHVMVFSSVPLDKWAHESVELWSQVLQLQGAEVNGKAGDTASTHCLSWLAAAGEQQRALLWSLLLSAKHWETPWCPGLRSVISTPAFCTLLHTVVDSLYAKLPRAELRTVMTLLYECSNNDDPALAKRTLDCVVSKFMQFPIDTLPLEALCTRVQKCSAVKRSAAVLILGAASWRALVDRYATIVCENGAKDKVVEGLLELLRPLLVGSTPTAALCHVMIVLTPLCLVELERMESNPNDYKGSLAGSLILAFRGALAGTTVSTDYDVCLASSWPLLPSLALEFQKETELQNLDGLREATAAARYVERTLAKESRAAVCLWVEEENPLASPSALAAKVRVVRHYGVREVGASRANIEKAKKDIFALLRDDSAESTSPDDAGAHAELACAKVTDTRRTRNNSLLTAISQKGGRRRSI